MNKILIIEGDNRIRENTTEILHRAGYHVISAENGEKGIESVKQEKPDMIICNTALPDMDGVCIPSILSKKNNTSTIPVVMVSSVTGNHNSNDRTKQEIVDISEKTAETASLLDSIFNRSQNGKGYEREKSIMDEFISQLFSSPYPFKLPNSIPSYFKTRTFAKKDSIYFEGDMPSSMYLVLKGRVKTTKMCSEGKEFITGIHEKGELFGHIAIFRRTDYVDSAIATLESEVLLIPKNDMLEQMEKNGGIVNQIIMFLSNEISEKEEKMKSLAYNSVRSRVAAVLLQLGAKKYSNEKKAELNSITVSREDLASMVGTASESLVRTLSDFRYENIIDTDRGKIVITDPECLERIRKFS